MFDCDQLQSVLCCLQIELSHCCRLSLAVANRIHLHQCQLHITIISFVNKKKIHCCQFQYALRIKLFTGEYLGLHGRLSNICLVGRLSIFERDIDRIFSPSKPSHLYIIKYYIDYCKHLKTCIYLQIEKRILNTTELSNIISVKCPSIVNAKIK